MQNIAKLQNQIYTATYNEAFDSSHGCKDVQMNMYFFGEEKFLEIEGEQIISD
jgi:hypothetical protein